jgi:AcrR family transcriptional regulator
MGDGAARRTRGRQERSKETRRRLIRAATRLWSQRGFDGVTVEELCSEAGVGRTTFYLHFESKERLLASLAGATAAGVVSDLEHVHTSESLDPQLDAFIRGVARRMDDVPRSLVQLVIQSQRAGAMNATPEQLAESTSFADILQEIVAAARHRGELDRAANPAELGDILGALTMDAIESWASRHAGDASLATVLRRRFAVVLDQYRT